MSAAVGIVYFFRRLMFRFLAIFRLGPATVDRLAPGSYFVVTDAENGGQHDIEDGNGKDEDGNFSRQLSKHAQRF